MVNLLVKGRGGTVAEKGQTNTCVRTGISESVDMAGSQGFDLSLLSTILLFIASKGPVVSRQSTGELCSTIYVQ